jgi:thioredoxin 1
MISQITDIDFEDKINESELPIVVVYGTSWCTPCTNLMVILAQIQKEIPDKIKICKMNIEDNPNIPSQLGIRTIPTMIIFKNGVKIAQKAGMDSKENISKWINDMQ